MTAFDPPEQLWDQVVQQLRLQMTQATFESWIKETMLLSNDAGEWHIGVKSSFAREWLENRLKPTILATIFHLTGQEVRLEFVVVEEVGEPLPAQAVISTVERVNGTHRAILAGPQVAAGDTTITLPPIPDTVERGSGLAIDIRQLNRTGYQPLTNYYPLFVEPYLQRRWDTPGQKAYALWEKVIALDGQQVINNPRFCNWTRPVTYSLKELAGLLADTSIQDLTGRYGYCWQANEARHQGQPLAACCQLYQPDCRFEGSTCKHWRLGILEVLSLEGVQMVEETGGRKNYRLTCQFWRSWPILTPHQVEYLPSGLQARHRSWLEAHSRVTGLTVQAWSKETSASAIEGFADRQLGRECQQSFWRNPFWNKERL
ncbi:MAG: hypothetical protein KJ077_21960 [Anaerolineae bacterium]|nr:hypothetical protein [Anaerolineae bacterium]